ncbi:MAG: SDR family oxidoreductase [Candidatus Krumholzibacteriia bacterium]
MSPSLAPQTALITGAGRGIGRAMARHLARRGMRVAVAARTEVQVEDTVAAIAEAGGEALALVCDVLDLESVQAAVTRVCDAWDRLDLLINNAGSLVSVGPLWQTDPREWSHDVDVNVRGVYHGCRVAVPVMLAAGRGRIVNLAGGGTAGPFLNASAYATSKAAVMRLTENLAAELDAARAPVRVFAVTPGLVRTAMTEQFLHTDQGRRWMQHTAGSLQRGQDVSPQLVSELVAAIAGGELDAYHGRLLSAPHDAGDLPALARAAEGLADDEDRRRLRIIRA